MTPDFFGQTRTGLLLHGEHQSTLGALAELESFISSRKPPPLGDAEKTFLARLDGLIEADVTAHFTFEEENLFPRVARAGGGFMVDMLQAEHESIRPLAQAVRAAIAVFLDQGTISDGSWGTFRKAARDLIEQETFHVQKEEMGLLAALAQIFEAAEDASIAGHHPKHGD